MSRLHFSPTRVRVLAGNTWREASRQRFFGILILVAISVALSAMFFREFNFGTSELKFIADFGFGAVNVFGSILTVVGAAQLLFSEFDQRTVHTVLAKPALRAEFILGKFLGIMMMIVIFAFVVVATVAGVLWWRERVLLSGLGEGNDQLHLVSFWGIAQLGLAQVVKFAVIAAATVFIGSYSRTNLFTVIATFLLVVICHLQPLAEQVWQVSDSWLTRIGARLLSWILPNFQLFNFGDRVAAGSAIPNADFLAICGYGFLYMAALLAIAVFSFSRREL